MLDVLGAPLAKVPITILGHRCERCGHEWLPKGRDREPEVCPRCKSPYWNRPRRSGVTYEDFKAAVEKTLRDAGGSLTWTEIRARAKLSQASPNNQWVLRMEREIGLE